jgi:hypothetical protein
MSRREAGLGLACLSLCAVLVALGRPVTLNTTLPTLMRRI